LVQPQTVNLNITSFAPDVEATESGTEVTVPTAELVLAVFAPTVTSPVIVTPAVLALVTSPFAPAVSTPVLVTPGVTALVITAFAPALTTPVVITPPTTALVISSFIPAVVTPRTVIVPATSLVLTPLTPVVGLSHVITPGTLALVLTTYGPQAGNPRIIIPGVVGLTITTFAPTVPTLLNLTVGLLEGATVRATWSYELTETPTTIQLPLTTVQRNAIVDWDDLHILVKANGTDDFAARVSMLHLVAPQKDQVLITGTAELVAVPQYFRNAIAAILGTATVTPVPTKLVRVPQPRLTIYESAVYYPSFQTAIDFPDFQTTLDYPDYLTEAAIIGADVRYALYQPE
jgi:hypothetical protein